MRLCYIKFNENIIYAHDIWYKSSTPMFIGISFGVIWVSLEYYGGSLGQKYAPLNSGVSSISAYFDEFSLLKKNGLDKYVIHLRSKHVSNSRNRKLNVF